MIKIGDFFFPDGEKHFAKFGDSVFEYGSRDRQAAYRYVKQWRRALDVGANVGIFSCDFASRFDHVVAFEPVPRTRDCLVLNVPPNVQVEPFAVADQEGVLTMYPTVLNCGGSFISNHPEVMTPEVSAKGKEQIEVQVRTIDSYGFDEVDLIKLDIQGAEYLALLGAKETIVRNRPVVLVEQKAVNAEHIPIIKKTSRMLRSWGMTAKEIAQSDRVFIFED
ncbi:FkbM family methyltransferase [Sphingomonas piscis]|uniref:FkbM family methyltransferase n=1 Tax=Sphingomonas piscis TaxID=2714943 RepID=A0A6G7YRN6_9SPHN|nr:FkbM family methyltransferase [Sphingomonas piscis]QIK79405.1 FkbM family methyltransferase [Sphingomonas piscis]